MNSASSTGNGWTGHRTVDTHMHTQDLGIGTLSHVWGYSIADSSCPFSGACPICFLLTEGKCERGGERRGKIRRGVEKEEKNKK